MRVGFTGTRQGMTNEQVLHVHMLLGDLQAAGAIEAHHGMCAGSDKQFHDMALALHYPVVGHPGMGGSGRVKYRAVCQGLTEERPPLFFLARNREIVKAASVVIATPKEMIEQERWSGTWATIRYTRQAGKPLIIVWPDGTGAVERVGDGIIMTLEEYREWLTPVV